ncbi:MAG: substrate-binding domain-containing protein [Firmicutes bacterium]|nr:substrate-binding domain-containing protein [Bacillota bacterium]
MASEKRRFLLVELLLAAVLSFLLLGLVLDRRQKPQKVIGVVIHQSAEGSWRGFLSGARAAAADEDVVLSVTENVNLAQASDFEKTVQDAVSSGAAALIAKPVTDGASLELLQTLSGRMPVILAGASDASVCSVTPDNYAMGYSVGEEIRADYESGLSGKTLGILLPEKSSGDTRQALLGLQDALDGSGVKILYEVKNSLTNTEGADAVQRQQWVDIVAALDDNNLGIAGDLSLTRNLHGAVVYGIGKSEKNLHLLEKKALRAVVFPDEFTMGYKSVQEAARALGRGRRPAPQTIPYKVLRPSTLFAEENDSLMYLMSR